MLGSMTMPRLRPAEVTDLPFILRQEREYIETIEPDAQQGWLAALDLNLADWIDSLPRTLFCIDPEGNPLGYAMWSVDGDTATLVSINVLGSRRREGLGRFLLEGFEQRAATDGARVVELGVHHTNEARMLYEGAGYGSTGRDGEYVMFSRVLSGS